MKSTLNKCIVTLAGRVKYFLPCLAIGLVCGADALPETNPEVTLCLQPLGEYDADMLAAADRGVRYVWGFDVRRMSARSMPKKAWYEPRKRWRADEILGWLTEEVHPDSGCTYVVGFTTEDISTTKGKHPDWGILGLGQIHGVAAVVSSFRTHKKLKPPHTATRRVVKVVNHEIGHVLGLPHNKKKGCLLNDAEGTVTTTDRETGLLCKSTIDYVEKTHGYTIPRHEKFDWTVVEK